MEPIRWETSIERVKKFFDNVWELWEISNQDQRWFLLTLIGLAAILSVLGIAHLRWRIANRFIIKKVKHFHSLQTYR